MKILTDKLKPLNAYLDSIAINSLVKQVLRLYVSIFVLLVKYRPYWGALVIFIFPLAKVNFSYFSLIIN
jgi:hypothetical protein